MHAETHRTDPTLLNGSVCEFVMRSLSEAEPFFQSKPSDMKYQVNLNFRSDV